MNPTPGRAVPLYGAAHAADPAASWDRLRRQGPVGIAEIDPGVSVYVVTDPAAALTLLKDTQTWSKDSRGWMDKVPLDSPVRPNIAWRHSLFFTDGEEHARLRTVITDSLRLLDPQRVREITLRSADTLLARLAPGGNADLVGQYARRLAPMVLNSLFGMPDQDAPRLQHILEALMGTDLAARAAGESALNEYVTTMVASKTARRGPDLASWFLDHPHRLTPGDVAEHFVITAGAAFPTLTGLIANALVRILSDTRYRGTLTGGTLTVEAAIDEALWQDPPLAMYSLHFPRTDVRLHGTPIAAWAPVMVSYAAVNTCPRTGSTAPHGHRSGIKAHLAFAAGPHACPARSTALLVAATAIERLISRLPDITLTVPPDELRYAPGPFYRMLTSLPCRFTSHTPGPGATRRARIPVQPSAATAPAAT
ncbi:cytochrome P450 [Streptomyces sp. NPDC048290]|uniref:cytochrome P450 n=1 Tax=Streptomyces sp. NPDC048290 TaxID=3155811 RepID=UPI0034210CF9